MAYQPPSRKRILSTTITRVVKRPSVIAKTARQLALPNSGGSPLNRDEVCRRRTKYAYPEGILEDAA